MTTVVHEADIKAKKALTERLLTVATRVAASPLGSPVLHPAMWSQTSSFVFKAMDDDAMRARVQHHKPPLVVHDTDANSSCWLEAFAQNLPPELYHTVILIDSAGRRTTTVFRKRVVLQVQDGCARNEDWATKALEHAEVYTNESQPVKKLAMFPNQGDFLQLWSDKALKDSTCVDELFMQGVLRIPEYKHLEFVHYSIGDKFFASAQTFEGPDAKKFADHQNIVYFLACLCPAAKKDNGGSDALSHFVGLQPPGQAPEQVCVICRVPRVLCSLSVASWHPACHLVFLTLTCQ